MDSDEEGSGRLRSMTAVYPHGIGDVVTGLFPL